MKKKSLLIGLFVVAAAATTFHFQSQKRELGDLLLENIEALAMGEIVSGYCAGTGSLDCPEGDIKVRYIVENYSLEIPY